MTEATYHLNGFKLSKKSVALLTACGMKPWDWWWPRDDLRVAFSKHIVERMIGAAGPSKRMW